MSTQAEPSDPRKWKIHRNRRGTPRWYQRWLEAFWIVTGKWSLHRAWQNGLDYGSHMEYRRIIVNGGDLVPIKIEYFNLGVEVACRRIESCNDETSLICRLNAARTLKNEWQTALNPSGTLTEFPGDDPTKVLS